MKLAMYLKKSHKERGIVREKYDLGQYLEQERSIQSRNTLTIRLPRLYILDGN